MKTALITFRNIDNNYNGKLEKDIARAFNLGGIAINDIYTFSLDDDLGFSRKFNELKDYADNLIVIDSEEVTFNIKEAICKSLGLTLIENDNAKKFIDAFNSNYHSRATYDYALLPDESTLIPNFSGAYQGFMLESEYLLIVIPNGDVETMCKKYVIPYIETKYGEKADRLTLKLFGVTAEKLESAITIAKKLSENKLRFNYETEYLDTRLDIIYDNSAPKMLVDEATRYFFEELGEQIYSEKDMTLAERLYDALTLSHKRLAVAESFTGGGLSAKIVSVSGASQVFNEGVVSYSNDAKKNRLSVKEETLKNFGAVSKETAYEMAAGLLLNKQTDYVITTTGIAGPKSDDTLKPVGLAYLGIGGRSGIHIHKLNLAGDRKTITETAINTALFLAIKHLKNAE